MSKTAYSEILSMIDPTQFVERNNAYINFSPIPFVIGDGTSLDEIVNDDLDSFGGLEAYDREITLMGNATKDCFVIVQLIYAKDKDDAIVVTQCLLAFSNSLDKLLTVALPAITDIIIQQTIQVSNLELRELLDDDLEADDDDDDDDDDDEDGKESKG